MKNYQGVGDNVTLTAPSGGVVAGRCYLIGATVVVAVSDAAVGVKFPGLRRGVVRFPKNTSDAIAEGAKVWWNPAANEVVNATETGAFVIGTALDAQLAAATWVDVVLAEVPSVAE